MTTMRQHAGTCLGSYTVYRYVRAAVVARRAHLVANLGPRCVIIIGVDSL